MLVYVCDIVFAADGRFYVFFLFSLIRARVAAAAMAILSRRHSFCLMCIIIYSDWEYGIVEHFLKFDSHLKFVVVFCCSTLVALLFALFHSAPFRAVSTPFHCVYIRFIVYARRVSSLCVTGRHVLRSIHSLTWVLRKTIQSDWCVCVCVGAILICTSINKKHDENISRLTACLAVL